MKRKKCYTYTRVSTAMQVDGYSLDAQQDRLNKFADFQKMDIVRAYCDAGKSGKSINGRPEFQQMLDDVANERDDVDYILVFKLSRFGRNAADVLNSLQNIQDYGVNLICVEDGIDSSKDSGKLTITVLSAVAEIERENILVQTMEGRKQKAREGKWNGGPPPYGYRLDSDCDSLIVDPEEAEIVRIVYDKFVNEGMGFQGISNYLNDRGYSKRKTHSRDRTYFSRSLIRNILDNPVYTGKIAYGRSLNERVKGTRDQYRRIKAEDFLLVDGRHAAIIDESLWMEAQERRKETGVRNVKTHSLEHAHILSGIVKCPFCGDGMSGTVRRKRFKDGGYRDDFYYRCQHRHKMDEEHFCNFKRTISQEQINHEVETAVLRINLNHGLRELILQKIRTQIDTEALERECEQLQTQLTQAEGAKKKLAAMMERLNYNDPHYDRKYQDMQDRLDNLYDKISGLENDIGAVRRRIRSAQESRLSEQQIYTLLQAYEKIYYRMTDPEKKEFMQVLIERIDIHPEEMDGGHTVRQIEFSFPVHYNGDENWQNGLLKGDGDETLCLLSNLRKKPDDVIHVTLDMEEYHRIVGEDEQN